MAPGKSAFESQDVADGGAPEGVDRLVGVADHHQLRRLHGGPCRPAPAVRRTARGPARTGRGWCPDTRRPARAGSVAGTARAGRGRPWQVHGGHDQVVEVERVRRCQPPLVLAIGVGVDLLVGRLGLRCGGFVIDQFVLAVRHPVHHGADGVPLRIDLGVMQHQLHQPLGVGVVVDREGAADPEPVDVGPQHADASRVEGGDLHRLRPVADHLDHPVHPRRPPCW